jgi:hypothetical protein
MVVLYKPPIKNPSVSMPYASLVTAADPDWSRRKYWDTEFEFNGKNFLANPYTRGAYNDNSNTYPVGQPFGGLDSVKIAAKAPDPSNGNKSNGLYSGTPDGKGWA